LEGADFAAFDSSSQYIEAKGTYTFDSTQDLVADVQDWLRTPTSNHGWMLLCSAEQIRFTARRFSSREDLSSPPQLAIEYLVPPHIDVIELSGNTIQLTFLALPDQFYTVQYRTSFTTGGWESLTNVGPSTSPTPVIITDTKVAPHRFYRLVTN
jgi:hypothetical protein